MTVQPTRDQLRALANAATEGPWSHADYGDPNPEHWPVGLIETDDGEEAWTCDTALAMSEPDAKFIAAARNAVPRLLDQLDQAEAELDSWMTRAYAAEKRAWQAEARIKAVQDVLDADEHVTKHMGTLGQYRPDIPAIAHDTIRRALESVNPPSA